MQHLTKIIDIEQAIQQPVHPHTPKRGVSYTHCDPLPKTGKPELVSGTWEMNNGILQHKAREKAPLAICNYVIPSDHYTITIAVRAREWKKKH